MNKEIGYNIYLPPGYETSARRYPVVYWLHGRNNTESSDQYPVHFLAARHRKRDAAADDPGIRQWRQPDELLRFLRR